jgi:cold shock CspA family protein
MIPVLEIYFDGLDKSEFVEEKIKERFQKLLRYESGIMGAYITVESPHQHRQRDRLYRVKIKLDLPTKSLNLSRDHWKNEAHRDVYVAIRDAFKSVERQLKEYNRIKRGDVKVDFKPKRAKISKIFYEQGYGFLETDDARELYFDANSVLADKFDKLELGQEVRYSEEPGNEGPQASTVAI